MAMISARILGNVCQTMPIEMSAPTMSKIQALRIGASKGAKNKKAPRKALVCLLTGGEGVPARAVYCSPRKAKLSTKTMTYELFFV
jgi:hypothetical protein